MAIASVNPTTGELLQSFEPHGADAIDERLDRAVQRLSRPLSLPERTVALQRAADLLEAEVEELARTMALEMGKPLRAARSEVRKCAWVCRYYAENASAMLESEPVHVGAKIRASIRYRPLGVLLAVMPWNFPFWQVFRFAAPALVAGNVALLKHASNVPQCALAIERLLLRAGFPEGSFQTLLIGADRVAALLADDRIAAVTLTGSDRAGAEVASIAGRHLKKVVLELGGSDPFVVMPSADLETAARTGALARTVNSGQSCIAAKRFIVHESVHDAFVSRFLEALKELRLGNPLNEVTDIGPLATASVRDEVDKQVRESIQRGARVLLGGERPDGAGFFYPPTVLVDVPEDAPARRDEVFGPVATVLRAKDLDDAIRIANDSPFGLGSSVWTQDEGEAERFIEHIEAGLVFVNAMVASDPRLPFGGVKRSGYGRELGVHGLREWVNVTTVWKAGDQETKSSMTE